MIKFYFYSQAYFVFKNQKAIFGEEKISGLDCITKSRKMMNGHKQDLFVLDLSFVGWEILSMLTLGISNIWQVPYRNVTYAAFYKIYQKIKISILMIQY